MEVTIREWVRPVYDWYADNIVQTTLLISISFILSHDDRRARPM